MTNHARTKEPAIPVPDHYREQERDFMERIENAKDARKAVKKAHETVRSRRDAASNKRGSSFVR